MKGTNLKSKLDRIFSIYIRLRDADQNGYCRCISCGKIVFWKQIHNGHFVNRKHMGTRYDAKNCNAQCVSCNSFDEGNNIGYTRGLIGKYGKGVIDELYVKKHHHTSFSEFEYRAMIKFYQGEVNRIKKEKSCSCI